MIECMFKRWAELGKPLFMVPRDFRDRILIGVIDKSDEVVSYPMVNEIRLSYLKWLVVGTEVDMFEIFCILILHA